MVIPADGGSQGAPDSSINIPQMRNLIIGMDQVTKNLPGTRTQLTSIMDSVYVDSSDTRRLATITAWVDGEIPGLRRRLALAEQIEAGTPSLRGQVSFYESMVPTGSPETAIRNGQDAAAALKNTDGMPSDALLSTVEKGMGDPYFANGFARSMTPRDLADVNLSISRYRDDQERGGNFTGAEYDAWKATYRRTLTAVGTTMGTASRGTGPLWLGPDYGSTWAKAITEKPYQDGGDAAPGEGAALALFLKYGTYSTTFLNQVSTQVYDYERQEGKDGGPVWKPMAQDGQGNFSGAYNENGGQAYDSLSSVLAGLAHNAQAAQNFFDGGSTTTADVDGTKGAEVQDRLKYLIQDRIWPEDQADGLGNALEAATTSFRDSSDQGRISAVLASQTFALTAAKTGQNNGGIRDFGPWADDGWKMYPGMRDSMARIMASYAPDMFRTAGGDLAVSDSLGPPWTMTDATDPTRPPAEGYGALMTEGEMQAILKTLGEDDKNIKLVLAGVAATYQVRLAEALRKDGAGSPDAFNRVIEDDPLPSSETLLKRAAATFGFVVDSGYQGGLSKEEWDEKRAASVNEILNLVAAVPAFKIPETAVKGGEYTLQAIDFAKGKLIDALSAPPGSDPTGTFGAIDKDTKGSIQRSALNALLQAGYLDPSRYAQANAEAGGALLTPPPASAFAKDPAGNPVDPPRFDFTSKGFQTWYANDIGPVDTWVTTNVVTPYNNEFPNIGKG